MSKRRNLEFKTLAFIGISTVLHAGFLAYIVASNYGSDVLSNVGPSAGNTVIVDLTETKEKEVIAPKIEVTEVKKPKLPEKSKEIIAKSEQKSEVKVVTENSDNVPVAVAKPVPVEEQLAEQIKNDVVTPAPTPEVSQTPENVPDTQTEAAAVVPAVVEAPAPENAKATTTEVPAETKAEASGPIGNTADASASSVIMPIRQDSELKAMPGNKDPNYAFEDRLAKRVGEIKFLAEVTPEGQVTNIRMLKSTGHKTLDMAALKSFKDYRYQPGQQGYVLKSFNFVLKGPARQLPSRLADRVAPSLAK